MLKAGKLQFFHHFHHFGKVIGLDIFVSPVTTEHGAPQVSQF